MHGQTHIKFVLGSPCCVAEVSSLVRRYAGKK